MPRCAQRIALVIAVVLGLLAWPAIGVASVAGPAAEAAFEDGTVLVGYRAGVGDDAAAAIEQQEGARRDAVVGAGTRVVQVGRGKVKEKAAAFKRHAEVAYAEPNYFLYADRVPNDPQFGQLWGLRNTGQGVNGTTGTARADIQAEPAWSVTTGTSNVVVGVVDTGIDYTHPDLAANVWSNPGGIGGCAVGTHGKNAITGSCDPLDDNNHGSHVSGTIGAAGNNGLGVFGVNWTTSIMGLKFLDASGSGTTAGAIGAIDFAVQAKIAGVNVRVLSNSWGGGGFSQALLDEINKANANDILFVAAAGNASANIDAAPSYPASYQTPNMIAVAATDQKDALASFSNYGATSVHLGAPGTNILSTVIGGTYAYYNGTSMATPHVSGAAALILAVSTLTTAQLKSTVLNSVDPDPALAGSTVTGGRLNVCKAIPGCGTATAPPPPPTPDFSLSASPASQSVVQGASTTYTVTVTPTNGFTGAVTLSASGLPAGAGGTFSPNPTTSTSTLSVTTTTSTPPGSYPLTITGASGTFSRTTSVTLNVTSSSASSDFSLSATPSSQTVARGASGTYGVTVAPTNGFKGSVNLSVSGLPTGATGSFSPNPTTASSTLTVTTSGRKHGGPPPGTYTLTITGVSGTLTRTTTVTLVVS